MHCADQITQRTYLTSHLLRMELQRLPSSLHTRSYGVWLCGDEKKRQADRDIMTKTHKPIGVLGPEEVLDARVAVAKRQVLRALLYVTHITVRSQ